jgi:hypothetical protein
LRKPIGVGGAWGTIGEGAARQEAAANMRTRFEATDIEKQFRDGDAEAAHVDFVLEVT